MGLELGHLKLALEAGFVLCVAHFHWESAPFTEGGVGGELGASWVVPLIS